MKTRCRTLLERTPKQPLSCGHSYQLRFAKNLAQRTSTFATLTHHYVAIHYHDNKLGDLWGLTGTGLPLTAYSAQRRSGNAYIARVK
jgi:hypothetical protein